MDSGDISEPNLEQPKEENDKDKNPDQEQGQKLSKRQQKRLLRQQKWLEQKPERKRREKERKKNRRKQIKCSNNEEPGVRKKPRPTWIKMDDSKCKVTVVIDCDYEAYMNDREMKKLCKQLNRCYALNRHSMAPVQLWFTSIRGGILNLLERLQSGHNHWDCRCTDKHWSEIFVDESQRQRLIYLSADSTETVPDCDQIQQSNDYVFIIGGLIDHNRHKGLALKRASEEFKVNHGRLPIDDYIKMCHRKVLSIPHVFEIMLLASNATMESNWTEIFKRVIPQRKLCNDHQTK